MKRLIKEYQTKQPYLSSLMIFTALARENGYTKADVNKQFDKYVDKRDYPEEERDNVLKHIYSLLDTRK